MLEKFFHLGNNSLLELQNLENLIIATDLGFSLDFENI